MMTGLALSVLEALEAKLSGATVQSDRAYLELRIRKLKDQLIEADKHEVKNPVGMV